MKLRLRGNSLRLRLTKADVARLVREGRVQETVEFPGRALAYVLERSSETEGVAALFDGAVVRVLASTSVLDAWTNTDLVGFEQEMPTTNGATLRLLVEKDWQCLTERAGEDEADAYPNPNTGCSPAR